MQDQTIHYVNDSEDLNERTFLLFAARHYDNPHCHEMDEFHDDLQIPMHLKKLFTRYKTNNVIRERLMINHVISLFNVFDSKAASKILFFRMEENYYSYLKTVLVFLNRCPEFIMLDGVILNVNIIEIDDMLMKKLERL